MRGTPAAKDDEGVKVKRWKIHRLKIPRHNIRTTNQTAHGLARETGGFQKYRESALFWAVDLTDCMAAHCYNLMSRVLLYREGKSHVAHALDLDLLGYGATEAAAWRELEDAVECQMSFAAEKGRTELLDHPAPKEFFERWEKAQGAALRGWIMQDKPAKLAAKATFIFLPKSKPRERPAGSRFQRAADPACA